MKGRMDMIVVAGQSCRSCPSLLNVVAVSRPPGRALQLLSCTQGAVGDGTPSASPVMLRASYRSKPSARGDGDEEHPLKQLEDAPGDSRRRRDCDLPHRKKRVAVTNKFR